MSFELTHFINRVNSRFWGLKWRDGFVKKKCQNRLLRHDEKVASDGHDQTHRQHETLGHLFHSNVIFCIFCSLNGTFYLSVEGTQVREISKIFWISAHLLDKFLTLGKRNGFLLLSFNRNFRTFDLAVEGTSVRQ